MGESPLEVQMPVEIRWVSPRRIFIRAWRRNAFPDGQRPWKNKESVVGGVVVFLLSLLATFLLAGPGDALAFIIPAPFGVAAYLFMPVVRTLKGYGAARADVYRQQIQPLVDEYDAHIEDRERSIGILRRAGRAPLPKLQPLEAEGLSDVRRRLQELNGLFSLAVSYAINTLNHHAHFLEHEAQHALPLIAQRARMASTNLSQRFEAFRLGLDGNADARELFIEAYSWYADVRAMGQRLRVSYAVQMSEHLHTTWNQADNEFRTRMLDIFQISELRDMRAFVGSYRGVDLFN
jgi:hypothetical protein